MSDRKSLAPSYTATAGGASAGIQRNGEDHSHWSVITLRNLLPRSDVSVVTLPLENGTAAAAAGGEAAAGNNNGSDVGVKRHLHFVIGGETPPGSTEDSSVVESIELPCRRSWRMTPLNESRVGCAAVLLRGVIYTVGGRSKDGSVLSTIEKYSFFREDKQWDVLGESSRTKVARWGHAAVTMPRKNAIFAIGGRNSDWQELSSVEVAQQSPAGDLHWNRLPYGMRQKRFGAAAVPIGSAAFMAIGGYNGSQWTDTVVLYEVDGDDVRDGVWTDLPEMPRAVMDPKAVVTKLNHKEYVFVAGATLDGSACIQVFAVDERKWCVMDTDGGEEGCTLAVEGDTLLCIGGDSNKVRCLDLIEESQKGILGLFINGFDENVVEVAAIPVEQHPSSKEEEEAYGPPAQEQQQTNPPPRSVELEQIPTPIPTQIQSPPPPPSAMSDTSPTTDPAHIHPPEPGPQRVENMDCVVDGEQARYSGEVNEAGQRHGQGLLMWADQNGSFYPKALSKNSYYEGEFFEDSRRGKGIFYVHNEGRLYEGTFERGVLFGEGTLTDVNRDLVYQGGFRKGMSNGEGRCQYHSTGQTFVGIWKRGKPVSGQLFAIDNRVIKSGDGPWSYELAVDVSRAGPDGNNGAAAQNGSRRTLASTGTRGTTGTQTTTQRDNRSGPPPPSDSPPVVRGVGPTSVYKMECVVEGEVVEYTGTLNEVGQRHGNGIMIWADEHGKFYPKELGKNTYYEGQFFEDSRSGDGLMYVKDENRTYRGTFERGVLTGEGILEDARRDLTYEGTFKKGSPNGEGKCIYRPSNRVFIGRWRKGQPFAGKMYNNQGQLLQQGDSGWGVELSID